MARRMILLIAAALVAAMGAGMVFLYVSSGDNNASAAEEAAQTVYTAAVRIDPGATGDSLGTGTVLETKVAASSVPVGSVTSLSQVAGLKAVTTIFPGQVLIASQFGDNNITGGLPIPADKLAIAIALGDPQRVAGFVQPGSKVAVFSTIDKKTELLLQNVTVIAVGPSTMTTTTQKSNGATTEEATASAPLTLALSEADAIKLVNAASGGELYLGLIAAA